MWRILNTNTCVQYAFVWKAACLQHSCWMDWFKLDVWYEHRCSQVQHEVVVTGEVSNWGDDWMVVVGRVGGGLSIVSGWCIVPANFSYIVNSKQLTEHFFIHDACIIISIPIHTAHVVKKNSQDPMELKENTAYWVVHTTNKIVQWCHYAIHIGYYWIMCGITVLNCDIEVILNILTNAYPNFMGILHAWFI